MINELKELNSKHYTLAVAGVAGLLSPGLLYIMQFKPELLESLDILKLILVCATLSLPTAIVQIPLQVTLSRLITAGPDVVWTLTMCSNFFIALIIVFTAFFTKASFLSMVPSIIASVLLIVLAGFALPALIRTKK